MTASSVTKQFQQPEPLNNDLTLLDPSGVPICVKAIHLELLQTDDACSEARLTFQVTPEQYQHIDQTALFHLKPELRGPLSGSPFQLEPNLEITATLQPQLLSILTEHITDHQAAIAYLSSLSQQLPDQDSAQNFDQNSLVDNSSTEITSSEAATSQTPASNPLVQTENWFALRVEQQQLSGATGYDTFWAYVSPSVIIQEATASESVSAAMGRFFKDWVEADQPISETAINEALEEFFKGLEAWADNELLPATEDAIAELLDEVTQAFDTWLDSPQKTNASAVAAKRPIYQAMVTFFSEDDWPFTKLQREPTLQLAFQGDHGQWNCYALARDEQSQFIFYSVCPVTVPENKRAEIAELLARANYGLVIGNFEFDVDNGEIRYKTSVDVSNYALSLETVQQLVYANVIALDRYMPGILAVLEQNVSPAEAIAQVENQPN